MKNPANSILSKVAQCTTPGVKVTDTKRARDQCPELKQLADIVHKQRITARSNRDGYEVARAKFIELIDDAMAVDSDLKNEVENASAALRKACATQIFDIELKKTKPSEKDTIKELRAKLAKLEEKKPDAKAPKSAAEVTDDSTSSSEEESE